MIYHKIDRLEVCLEFYEVLRTRRDSTRGGDSTLSLPRVLFDSLAKGKQIPFYDDARELCDS
jgi:hypothetical protein